MVSFGPTPLSVDGRTATDGAAGGLKPLHAEIYNSRRNWCDHHNGLS